MYRFFIAAAAFASLLRTSSAEGLYSVTPIFPPPDGVNVGPVAVNNAGMAVINYRFFDDRVRRPYLYQNGALAPLPLPANAAESAAEGMNGSGTVVGFIATDEDDSAPAVWRNNSYSLLEHTGYDVGIALGINSQGLVVGYVQNNSPDSVTVPAYWDGSGMHLLNDFPDGAVASAVNDSGAIVITTSSNSAPLVTFEDGQFTALQTGTLGSVVSVYAINNAGDIVGFAVLGGTLVSVLWHNGVPQILPTPAEDAVVYATSINNSGQIAARGDAFLTADQALLYQQNDYINLRDYVQGYDWDISAAYSISDNGNILGIGFDETGGQYIAVIATPVPEPTSALLLAVGATFLLNRRKRSR